MRTAIRRMVIAVALIGAPLLAAAQVPQLINHQGILKDTGGNLAPDGDYSITVRMYATGSGGTPLWEETQIAPVTGGLFNVILGTSQSLDVLAFDQDYWMSLDVEGFGEMTPRVQLTATPYALRARVADSVVSVPLTSHWDTTGSGIYYDGGNVGIGTSAPTDRLHVSGTTQVMGFKMPTGAVDGYVLMTDSSGLGIWQPPGSGNLPPGTAGQFRLNGDPVSEAIDLHTEAMRLLNDLSVEDLAGYAPPLRQHITNVRDILNDPEGSNVNFEGLGWFKQGERLVVVYDGYPVEPTLVFFIDLPDAWR